MKKSRSSGELRVEIKFLDRPKVGCRHWQGVGTGPVVRKLPSNELSMIESVSLDEISVFEEKQGGHDP